MIPDLSSRLHWIGHYRLPFDTYAHLTLLELSCALPWPRVLEDEGAWWPWEPQATDPDAGIPLADFYLSPDGEELIGSYLGSPPQLPTCRFLLLLRDEIIPDVLMDRDEARLEPTPTPERVLRLVWLEE